MKFGHSQWLKKDLATQQGGHVRSVPQKGDNTFLQ